MIPSTWIPEVVRALHHYCGVMLLDRQAMAFITSETGSRLRKELKEKDGIIYLTDSKTMDILGQTFVDFMFQFEHKPTEEDPIAGSMAKKWHFPQHDSSEHYRDEFHIKLFQIAARKRIRLGGTWDLTWYSLRSKLN